MIPEDYMPTDWKKYHAEKLAAVDPQLRQEAVAMLRHELATIAHLIRIRVIEDPQEWWVPYHLFWGMGVRNLLREKGFTDEAMGVNLDEVYVGLVEEALL